MVSVSTEKYFVYWNSRKRKIARMGEKGKRDGEKQIMSLGSKAGDHLMILVPWTLIYLHFTV